MQLNVIRLAFLLLLTFCGWIHPLAADTQKDHRTWQHGIDFVQVGNRSLLIWGSWGNPPTPLFGGNGNWQHDIYYSWIDKTNPTIRPQILVSTTEAQEPSSTAINDAGRILVTFEDGNGGEINQRAGLWDSNLKPVKDIQLVREGGHSGDVAASGNQFLIAYSEEWMDGGSFMNLGTGKNMLARIVSNEGVMGDEIEITLDTDPNKREDWPLVAGSPRDWLIIWQRYPERSLQGALIGKEGSINKKIKIANNLKAYHYNVAYVPKLDLYAVMGTNSQKGFIALIDHLGKIVATKTGLPPPVSESQIIFTDLSSEPVTAVYPVKPRGIAVINFSATKIKLVKKIPHSYRWDYMGTTGVMVTLDQILFATLSTRGVHLFPVKIN